MTTFQQIGLLLLGLCVLATLMALVRHSIQLRAGLAWLAVWVAAAIAIIDPDITFRLARAVGIGRGADLVFYCAILAMIFGGFMIYLRFKRLEREITVLVRHLAILDAERTERG